MKRECLTAEEFRAKSEAGGYSRGHKYRAVRTEVDGIAFDSRGEAARYGFLKLREKAGEIRGLTLQPSFLLQPAFLDVTGTKHRAIWYRADFAYDERVSGTGADIWTRVVEDFKGVETPVFRLKRKLFLYKFAYRLVVTGSGE